MAESFETVLCDWAKIRYKKKSFQDIEQVREAGRSKKNPFLF